MFFANKNPEELLRLANNVTEDEENVVLHKEYIQLLPESLEPYREELEATLKLSNEITFVRGTTQPWKSKLGGCPYLENVNEYPRDRTGQPMMFLAQINLEEMPPLPDFPTKGILQFYVTDDDVYGLEDGCVVKYIPTYHKDESKLLSMNPFHNQYKNYEPFDTNCKIYFTQRKMFISSDVEKFDEMFYDRLSSDEYDQLYDICHAEESRVGGYPMFVQNSPSYYDDGTVDILLLQLDVDGTSGLMFGDGGNCCFFISKQDLKNLDFSNVEYDWQCC